MRHRCRAVAGLHAGVRRGDHDEDPERPQGDRGPARRRQAHWEVSASPGPSRCCWSRPLSRPPGPRRPPLRRATSSRCTAGRADRRTEGVAHQLRDSDVVAADDWEFGAVTGSPAPYGPTAIGWTPTGTRGRLRHRGVLPRRHGARRLPDRRSTRRRARRRASPRSTTTRRRQCRLVRLLRRRASTDFVDTRPAGTPLTPATCKYDWFRLTNDDFDGTFVENMTIADFTALHGAGTARARSSSAAMATVLHRRLPAGQLGQRPGHLQLRGLPDPGHLASTGGRPDQHLPRVRGGVPAAGHLPGRMSPGGPWEGQQYVGRRNGHWRVVARGNTIRQLPVLGEGLRELVLRRRPSMDSGHAVRPQHSRLVRPRVPSHRGPGSQQDDPPGQGAALHRHDQTREKAELHARCVPSPRARSGAPSRAWVLARRTPRATSRSRSRPRDAGWARINILTKTEKDLTSALTPARDHLRGAQAQEEEAQRGPEQPDQRPRRERR